MTPGSADALRKALEDAQSFISGFVARTEYDTEKPWVGGNAILEQIRAALSADAALSQQGMVTSTDDLLEQRAFAAANQELPTAEIQQLIRDLWEAYCTMERFAAGRDAGER